MVVARFAATVRQTMASQLQVPLLPPSYNYRHKVQYHTRLRQRYHAHPRGPLYAMCLAPMQSVLDEAGGSRDDDEDEDDEAYGCDGDRGRGRCGAPVSADT